MPRIRATALIALGLTSPDPGTKWFDDLDRALEWIESELLRKRWPNMSTGRPVSLDESPLTKDFSRAELEELRACLHKVDLPPGPLFKRGEPGTSLYIVDRGVVEIRIGGNIGGKPTRLAAFGPGSIFGEIALLNSDERTADALCMTPTQLYELQREVLMNLKRRSPRLYAHIIENINAHLASRLIIATSIVRAHR